VSPSVVLLRLGVFLCEIFLQWCNIISYFIIYDYSSIYESLVDFCVNEFARVSVKVMLTVGFG
jgi:hypothetical protein